MKNMKTLKIATGVLFIAALMVSCVPKSETMGDAGQTLVKLSPSGFTLLALDAKTSAQTGVLFEVRRDVHSQAALNSATTVVLTFDTDTSLLKQYNEDEETEFIPLPVSLATTTPALTAGKVTLQFGPGEFSKAITVSVPNATLFDFSKQYALAYTLTEVSGTGVISEGSDKTVIAQVLVKNKYDGKYTVTANSDMIDIVVPTLTGWYPFTYELETSGENSCTCLLTDPGYFTYYHPITSGGSPSAYGSFGIEIFFDPATGNVTGLKNPWGSPAPNTRDILLDDSQTWKYDAATKTVRIKYYMTMSSAVPTPPHIRTTFDETWTYKGPR